MKNLISLVGAVLMLSSVVAVPVFALVKANDNIVVRADEEINDDFFAAGDEVTIEGTINGDVYVGASRLMITGEVNGDVIAAAENIEVSGLIRDDLRAVGNNISLIGAEIGDSVSVAGNDLSIDRNSEVGGGLIFGGRLLTLDGSVGRGIISGSETTRLDGPVGKTVRIAANTIDIDEEAVIRGDLEYRSDSEASIMGKIKGEVIRSEGGLEVNTESFFRWFIVGYNVWAFVAAAIVGGLLMLLVPQLFNRARTKFFKRPWRTVGVGALVLLATIPASILLAVTVFGIPLAFIVIVLWLLSLYFAKFFVAFAVGRAALGWLRNQTSSGEPRMYSSLLIGLVLYYLLRIIPGIGILVRLATTIVGMGMIMSLYQKPKREKQATNK